MPDCSRSHRIGNLFLGLTFFSSSSSPRTLAAGFQKWSGGPVDDLAPRKQGCEQPGLAPDRPPPRGQQGKPRCRTSRFHPAAGARASRRSAAGAGPAGGRGSSRSLPAGSSAREQRSPPALEEQRRRPRGSRLHPLPPAPAAARRATREGPAPSTWWWRFRSARDHQPQYSQSRSTTGCRCGSSPTISPAPCAAHSPQEMPAPGHRSRFRRSLSTASSHTSACPPVDLVVEVAAQVSPRGRGRRRPGGSPGSSPARIPSRPRSLTREPLWGGVVPPVQRHHGLEVPGFVERLDPPLT